VWNAAAMKDRVVTSIRHILLPTDYSDLARNAAAYARALAEKYGATLHLVHVVERVPVAVAGPESSAVALAASGPEALAAAREAMARFVEECLADLAVPVVTHILEGTPHAQIARYATESFADLIVIGTHARGVVRRIFLGSTSKSVMEHAPCPVLMVPLAQVEPEVAPDGSAAARPAEVSP
jgi:nucleotide-binding universal stress UspA family protein